MSTKAKTDYSKFTFTVKEDANGTPWIMCEPYPPGLPALGDSFLGLHLRPGITIEQASEIAEYLRDHVEGISHTQLIR
jgi:hypothetical protein